MENRHLKYEVPLTCPLLGAWEQPLLSLFSLVVVVVAVYGLSSEQAGTKTANCEKNLRGKLR